jgi:hypothetical protein
LEHGRLWFWMVMMSPSSTPRRLTVALSRGPPVEGMGRTVSTILGSDLQPEGGTRNTAERCDNDGMRARFGGREKIHPGSSGGAFL